MDNNQIKADMNLSISHLDDTDLAERILDLKELSLKSQVDSIAAVGSEIQLRQHAESKFDSIFGQSVKNLGEWINNFRQQKGVKRKDYSSAIADRDKHESKIRGEVIRKVEWTGGERFEYLFLIFGAILLWLVGYLSLVQVIKTASDGSSLTNFAAWLLPLAGVTVMALMIKILLSRLEGTKAFNVLLTVFIIAGLAASLTWLFCFSGFIQQQGAPVALPSIDGAAQSSPTPAPAQSGGGESNALYIIVSILGEALGAGACYAYAASIERSKTIFAMMDNPAWLDYDKQAGSLDLEIRAIDEKIICAEGLLSSIEAKRKNFSDEVYQAFKNKQTQRLEQEEKEINGGGQS